MFVPSSFSVFRIIALGSIPEDKPTRPNRTWMSVPFCSHQHWAFNTLKREPIF